MRHIVAPVIDPDLNAAVTQRLMQGAGRIRDLPGSLPSADNAMMLIERNINLKILFCDLVDRLYILI